MKHSILIISAILAIAIVGCSNDNQNGDLTGFEQPAPQLGQPQLGNQPGAPAPRGPAPVVGPIDNPVAVSPNNCTPGTLRWRYHSPRPLEGQPIAALDGRVWAVRWADTMETREIIAVDADGKLTHTVRLKDLLVGSRYHTQTRLTRDDRGQLFVSLRYYPEQGSHITALIALDSELKAIWILESSAPTQLFSVQQGRIVLVNLDTEDPEKIELRVISTADGSVLNRMLLSTVDFQQHIESLTGSMTDTLDTIKATHQFSSPMFGANGQFYLTVRSRKKSYSLLRMVAFDLESGRRLWTTQLFDKPIWNIPSPLASPNGGIFAAVQYYSNTDKQYLAEIVALDPATGSRLWSETAKGMAPASAEITTAGLILLRGKTKYEGNKRTETLFRFDVASRTLNSSVCLNCPSGGLSNYDLQRKVAYVRDPDNAAGLCAWDPTKSECAWRVDKQALKLPTDVDGIEPLKGSHPLLFTFSRIYVDPGYEGCAPLDDFEVVISALCR